MKTSEIVLKPVKKDDYRFLFELLQERKENENISHKNMPTFSQHKKFVSSRPYSKWYIIYNKQIKIGSAYLSKQDEIGIHIKKKLPSEKFRLTALNFLIEKNPRNRYLVNINPKNTNLIRFYKKHNFLFIQKTFELIP
jgi:hypothetical protein